MDIRCKRAYDDPADNDGHRVLVDAMWPRGVSKEEARLDEWLKDVAPSDDLREWFDHDPDKWDEFRDRYHEELDDNDAVDDLLDKVRDGRVTLVYAAKDEEHNNAVALRDYLKSKA
ncbi:DUF488 domain-containing protein [Roseovarius sp. SCSIO 43702]|uniref:DUF488 domain-containing protein n=1 Tax=Roseovarius sp. SCSIO 43702 TaxID=2823043 RepID=UPI001C732D39|nr:DUF488 domain-containing protein [Roseovarius sp. SCSIO 43702]QYX56342.1 DUF488 domain-containing protein [Roseovarius sp. SCSIO 43702]